MRGIRFEQHLAGGGELLVAGPISDQEIEGGEGVELECQVTRRRARSGVLCGG